MTGKFLSLLLQIWFILSALLITGDKYRFFFQIKKICGCFFTKFTPFFGFLGLYKFLCLWARFGINLI